MPHPPFDNTQAFSEGWGLFNDGELQRLDHGPIDALGNQSGQPAFASDEDALAHVHSLAAAGSAYHAHALTLLTPPSRSS